MTQVLDENNLLRVDDLHVVFESGKFRKKEQAFALRGVSLSIHKGETVAIVGESGCGKTTLARTLVGLQDYTRGKLTFNSRDLEFDSKTRKLISFVFQDPYSSLNPRFSVSEIIKEPMHQLSDNEILEALNLDFTNKKYNRRKLKEMFVEKLLVDVQLSKDISRRYPFELSGGQKQRVGIARALACSPKLLIMDEPVSSLDVSVQAGVMETLRKVKENTDISIIFITHDLRVARYIADRVVVMYAGQVMEDGPTQTVYSHPCHPYTAKLFSLIPKKPGETSDLTYEIPVNEDNDLDTEAALEEIHKDRQDFTEIGCPYRLRCEKAQEICENQPTLAQMTDARLVACHFPN